MTIGVFGDAYSSGEAPSGCVFFTQHISEIVRIELWAGQFFVACRNPLVKVIIRRRGEPQVDSSGVFRGVEGSDEFWGLRGPSGGAIHPAIDGTLPHGTNNWRFEMKTV